MRPGKAIAVSVIILLVGAGVPHGGTSQIKGYMFGDYLYNVANHNESEENFNEFQFRRIYFTFESNLNSDIKVRLRLEAETKKTTDESLISPFVKDAYVEWANLVRGHNVVIGLSSPPTWELSEGVWGYRSIEKAIMDFRQIRSSREMGVGLKGALDPENRFNHHLMIGNGKGYKGAEDDKYKLFMYSFWVVPTEGVTLQLYADYQRKKEVVEPSDTTSVNVKVNDVVYKGFLAYEKPQFTVGAEGFQQAKRDGIFDKKNLGISVFGSAIPVPGSTFKIFGRFDYWDPDTDVDDNEESLIIGGVDFIPAGNVHIMPNVMIRTYAEEDKESDVTGRITFYYKWSSGKF